MKTYEQVKMHHKAKDGTMFSKFKLGDRVKVTKTGQVGAVSFDDLYVKSNRGTTGDRLGKNRRYEIGLWMENAFEFEDKVEADTASNAGENDGRKSVRTTTE